METAIERTQIVIPKTGSADVLTLEKSPLPALADNEVTIKVGAAGINFADILARQGLYQDAPPLPAVMGYEMAGEVVAQGEFVTEKHGNLIGKRVFGLTRFGGYSDYVNVPADQVFLTPDSLTDIQAASIPVAYLTAYQLVVVMGGLKKGETVLIHNVGGAVGLAALDLAKHIGARTIGTASSRKHAFLKERGLDHVIDYTQGDWVPEVMNITDNFGAELILDPLGGESFSKSYGALRKTGRLGMFGISVASGNSLKGKLKLAKTALSMPLLQIHPINLMMQNKSAFGVNLGHMWDEVAKITEWTHGLLDGLKEGWVRPHVHDYYKFSDVAKAHQAIENRENIGKVLLVPDALYDK